MNQTNEQIKPCPFCGEAPGIVPWYGGGPDQHLISCANDECDVMPMIAGESREEAIATWNRPPQAHRGGVMERCKPTPEDQAGPVRRIEITFAIPVNITREYEKRLYELLDDIVSHPSNQIVDGVHWVSAYGGKMLWKEPEEPDIDMDTLAIETTARPFVSDRERDRTLKEREEIWKDPDIDGSD